MLIKFGILAACFTILYARVIEKLVYDWAYLPDFSHGFLVPLISSYLVYEKRRQLAGLIPSGQWKGLGLTVLGIFLYFLGNLAKENFSMSVSIIIVIGGIILFLLGERFLKTLLFPLVFLIFMIPIPSIFLDRITFPMQLFASKVATRALDLAGIPVLREGNILYLANTSLEVAEACSGIRSLISLLALSVVVAYFYHRKNWKRIVLIFSTLPVAVIANAARVSGTGILAYAYDNSVAQGFFHGFSGWILFAIAFICLLGVASALSRDKK